MTYYIPGLSTLPNPVSTAVFSEGSSTPLCFENILDINIIEQTRRNPLLQHLPRKQIRQRLLHPRLRLHALHRQHRSRVNPRPTHPHFRQYELRLQRL